MSALPSDSMRNARADAQRDRILNAAERCFAERGFHAASMASIAETAQMSPGLIYRYFESKSAIIHGIVQRHLQRMSSDFRDGPEADNDVVELLMRMYYSGQCREGEKVGIDSALLMEIVAEATRDPEIASALAAVDEVVQANTMRWLQARTGGRLDDGALEARALLFRSVVDGLKARQARDPQLPPAMLRAALQRLITSLLAD